jgi:hypothetical protein
MSCNCKNQNDETNIEKIEITKNVKFLNTIVNFLIFLILFVISVPLIIPFVGYMLFKAVVLKDNTINTFNLFYNLGKKLMEKENESDDIDLDDEDDDNYELELEDVELVNVDENNK